MRNPYAEMIKERRREAAKFVDAGLYDEARWLREDAERMEREAELDRVAEAFSMDDVKALLERFSSGLATSSATSKSKSP